MNCRRILKVISVSVMICSLVATGFGGAYVNAAYAAESGEDEQQNSGISKEVIGGLVAIGLIAAISSSRGSNDSAPQEKAVSTTPGSSTSQPKSPETVPSSGSMSADEQKAFKLLNADRAKNGLAALKWNSELASLAEKYGQEMIDRKFFSHYTPEGEGPFKRMSDEGINYTYAGENLAINTSVAAAETAFMNSPGHRANILNSNYTEVGVGVRYANNGSVYVVQEFIRP